jgi:DNA-binding NarL/FixJ family response regulator
MIRVAIVEDQALLRDGLQSLLALAPDIEISQMMSTAEEALAVLVNEEPDVLLLDLRLPGMSGIELLRRLREQEKCPPTLVLTTFDDASLLFGSIQAGARGYLLKDVRLEELLHAIRVVASGGRYIKPGVTEHILETIEGALNFPAGHPLEHLTTRELEVLRLLANGCSNREIGELLEISEGTVKNHVSIVLAKLGVSDRTKAVMKALAAGLLRHEA